MSKDKRSFKQKQNQLNYKSKYFDISSFLMKKKYQQKISEGQKRHNLMKMPQQKLNILNDNKNEDKKFNYKYQKNKVKFKRNNIDTQQSQQDKTINAYQKPKTNYKFRQVESRETKLNRLVLDQQQKNVQKRQNNLKNMPQNKVNLKLKHNVNKKIIQVELTQTQSQSQENIMNQNCQYNFQSDKQFKKLNKRQNHTKQGVLQKNFLSQLDIYLEKLSVFEKKKEPQNQQERNRSRRLSKSLKILEKEKSSQEQSQCPQSQDQQTIVIQKLKQEKLKRRIKTEKSINRNMQKCILQIQSILFERINKLQMLQDQMETIKRNKSIQMPRRTQNGKYKTKNSHSMGKFSAQNNQMLNQRYNKKKNLIVYQQKNQLGKSDKKKQKLNQNQSIPINELSKIYKNQTWQVFEDYPSFNKQTSSKFNNSNQRHQNKLQKSISNDLQRLLLIKSKGFEAKRNSYSKFQKKILNKI